MYGAESENRANSPHMLMEISVGSIFWPLGTGFFPWQATGVLNFSPQKSYNER
jgi:hypothetical protein